MKTSAIRVYQDVLFGPLKLYQVVNIEKSLISGEMPLTIPIFNDYFMTSQYAKVSITTILYVQAKRALSDFFVECAFLVMFDSLFHTADDGTII